MIPLSLVSKCCLLPFFRVEENIRVIFLNADPEASIRQLYRYIILGQTFGSAPVCRDELRFILVYAREAFLRGRNRVTALPSLPT